MANYQITPGNSVTTTADNVHAFNGDTPQADTLTVDSTPICWRRAQTPSARSWRIHKPGRCR